MRLIVQVHLAGHGATAVNSIAHIDQRTAASDDGVARVVPKIDRPPARQSQVCTNRNLRRLRRAFDPESPASGERSRGQQAGPIKHFNLPGEGDRRGLSV